MDERIASHGPTAMVGDGNNDSQALLRCLSAGGVGGPGADAGHARRARRFIVENITVALGAKAV